MATTTRIHGGLPEGVRDHDGVFGAKPDASPQSRLAQARAKVRELEHAHNEAQVTLRAAIDDDNGRYDFVALKTNVHNSARDLAEAEEQVAQWESVCAQVEKAERGKRFDAALIEAREARQKFTQLYRDACLALGRWYGLGGEIRGLVSELADKMPTGHVYRPPHLTEALKEVDADPNPLHQLLDNGYCETQTFQSWRRQVAVVPRAKKEK